MAFDFNKDTYVITMHKGDTGSKWIHATRGSAAAWTSADRCQFTVMNSQNEVMMKRFYRLDDQWGAGDGRFLMEFHNGDTDTWPAGTYNTEWRYDIDATWDGTAPTGRCVNGMTAGVAMTDGSVVRTKVQSTLTIQGVLGDI